jgi:hypothetical protein
VVNDFLTTIFMPFPHTFIKLTADERKQVSAELQRLAVAGQWRKRKPLQALHLSDQGRTFDQIAEYLKITYRVVQMWFARYKKEGVTGFLKHEK